MTRAPRLLLTGFPLSVLLIVVHGTNDAFTSMLAALLPTLQLRFGISETVLAALVATMSFSSSVTQPFFGAIADRLGRRVVAAAGVALSSGLLSLMGVAPSAWVLFALLLVGGLGSGAFHPAATGMAREAAKRGNPGLAMGLFSAGGTIGLAIGPLVIGYFVMNGWLRFSPWLMVPGLALAAVLYLFVPPQRNAGAKPAKLFDFELFRGPVGALAVAGTLRSISWVAFINAAPLWLVHSRGVATDSPVLFWTLTAFNFSGGLGGILIGMLEGRASRGQLITGTMLLAVVPLYSLFLLEPGSAAYFLAVALAGALINGGLPLMVVSAQDLAPHAVGTASGMLMGLTWGAAGVLYLGIGALQEAVGFSPAMAVSFLSLVPGAVIANRVLTRAAAARGA